MLSFPPLSSLLCAVLQLPVHTVVLLQAKRKRMKWLWLIWNNQLNLLTVVFEGAGELLFRAGVVSLTTIWCFFWKYLLVIRGWVHSLICWILSLNPCFVLAQYHFLHSTITDNVWCCCCLSSCSKMFVYWCKLNDTLMLPYAALAWPGLFTIMIQGVGHRMPIIKVATSIMTCWERRSKRQCKISQANRNSRQ